MDTSTLGRLGSTRPSGVRSQDWIDGDPIGVWGGSYDGFAVLSCVTRLPDYWRAAIDILGPSNLVTFAKAVPPMWKRLMEKWVGNPETDVDFLMERSPITYVDNRRAPLLVKPTGSSGIWPA